MEPNYNLSLDHINSNKISIKFNIDFRNFKKGQYFEFNLDKSLCFCGDNGTGKSTIVQLIVYKSIINFIEKSKINNDDTISINNLLYEKYKYINYNSEFKSLIQNNSIEIELNNFDFNIFCLDNSDNRHLNIYDEDNFENVINHFSNITISNGESKLGQLYTFLQTPGLIKNNKWLIIDEPDSNASCVQSYMLCEYFPKTRGIILICHNPILIKSFDNVYYFKIIKNNNSSIQYIPSKNALLDMKNIAKRNIMSRKKYLAKLTIDKKNKENEL